MKKYLFGLALLLSVSLCGCNNGSDEQQMGESTGIIESAADQKEELQDSTLTENVLPNSSDDINENGTNENDVETGQETELLMAGDMGILGIGTLVYTVPDRDDEDYRLYFFPSGNEEEASFVFPDVRDGNAPIGIFKEIYYMDYTDISKDGSADVIVVAVYEKDGARYFDTRVYEEGEYGFAVNTAFTQELNEKYYNVEDYPIEDILTLPGDSVNLPNEYTIEGFGFVDGMEKPVCVTLSVESIQRGEAAYEILQEYNAGIASPNENEEYIIITFNNSYDSGEIEELYMMENRASLGQAGLYFTLANGQSNAYDVTLYLSNSIYDISLTEGQNAQGAVAFLQGKENTEPLVFVGFEQTVRFDINGE